jgi:hypothetical protein
METPKRVSQLVLSYAGLPASRVDDLSLVAFTAF